MMFLSQLKYGSAIMLMSSLVFLSGCAKQGDLILPQNPQTESYSYSAAAKKKAVARKRKALPAKPKSVAVAKKTNVENIQPANTQEVVQNESVNTLKTEQMPTETTTDVEKKYSTSSIVALALVLLSLIALIATYFVKNMNTKGKSDSDKFAK